MPLLHEPDTEAGGDAAQVRAAIDRLADRERAALHRIHDVIDLREAAAVGR